MNVPITIPKAAHIVGAPKLTLAYSGTAPAGPQPTRVFAQLVDDATGLVLGNQITPIKVTLDGKPHSITVPLEMVSFTAQPGAKLTLQLVATTIAYTQPRLGGKISFDDIDDRAADRHRRHPGARDVAALRATRARRCGSRRTARRAPGTRW